MQSSADAIDFLFGQSAGASANQHSVLVVQAVSPFIFGPKSSLDEKAVATLSRHRASVSILPGTYHHHAWLR
jgi:hypothetical protein